jgi:hypothetical protein
MHFGLAGIFAWMVLAAGTSPTPAPATDEMETLIGQLRDVGSEGIGFSTSVSGWEFLPYPDSGEAGAMLLGQAPPEPSPILRKVIEKGVAVVPALLAHIDDGRPTKLPPVKRMMWMNFADEYDYNRRLSKRPVGVDRRGADGGLRAAFARRPSPEEHVVTVGDLCFVALGQIVNRNFEAVRYQPTGGMVINSPSSSKALAAAARAEWGGLTPASHRERLVQDALQPDSGYRRIGAYYRLSFYYPDATEDVVQKTLVELFGRGREVKSSDRPFPSSVAWGDSYQFIKALTHDTSRRVDEAVRGILAKTTDDDMLAIACMRRLMGRGFDDDIRRYATRRAPRSQQHGDELRAILESLH